MKISVIIPIFNASKTLRACLDSVFRSHCLNFEVIAVDDKSEDDSLSILKEYPCQIIALNQNAGTANARNVGAQEANGDFFVFIDSDVVIQQNTLEIVADEMEQHPQVAAVTGFLSCATYEKNFLSEYKNL